MVAFSLRLQYVFFLKNVPAEELAWLGVLEGEAQLTAVCTSREEAIHGHS